MDRIRATCKLRPLTNHFSAIPDDAELTLLASEHSLLFARTELGVKRLYFFSANVPSLSELLGRWVIDVLPTVAIGYVDRNKNESLCAAFRQHGFIETGHYLRMTCNAFPPPASLEEPEFAGSEDLAILSHLIRSNFDPVTDHLPSMERLQSLISNREIIVQREHGVITGLIAFPTMGRQVNLNYLLNLGRRGQGQSLMQKFLICAQQRGIRSGFLWVDIRNARALRLYTKCGWKADGLNDWFFQSRDRDYQPAL